MIPLRDENPSGTPPIVTIAFIVLCVLVFLWQLSFGADIRIVGNEMLLNGNKFTVIGVLPKDFSFPQGEINPADFWTPLQLDPANPGGADSHS